MTTPMPSASDRRAFWFRWLLVAAAGLTLFGLSMLLAPGVTRQFFSLLIYSSAESIDSFGQSQVAYVTLVHAVLGAVMLGWGVLMLYVIVGPFRRGAKEGWRMLAVSVTAWFVPDTLFSLASGFWQNAVLNAGLAVVFAVPLVASFRSFHDERA
jgi:hypothetical protein